MCLIKVNNILNYNYQSTIIINILINNNKKNKQQAHKYAMLLELMDYINTQMSSHTQSFLITHQIRIW